MKVLKLQLLIGMSIMIFSGCSKNDVPAEDKINEPAPSTEPEVTKTKKVLVINITGTWCHFCGQTGIGAFNEILKRRSNVFGMSVHSGDLLANKAGKALSESDNFNESYFPRYGVGSTMTGGTYVDSMYTASENVKEVDKVLASAVTVNAVMFDKKIEDGKLTVTVKTKFFSDVQAVYYLSLYLVEDRLIADQSTVDDGNIVKIKNYIHDHVLRSAYLDLPYGELITTAPVQAGAIVKKLYTLPVNSTWKTSNLRVGFSIWKKTAEGFEFENAGELK